MNNFLIMFVEKVCIVWISEEENRFFVHFVRRDGLGFVRRAKKAREQALNQMQLRFCHKKAQSEDCGRIACYSIFLCFFSCSNIDCLMR